MQRGSAKDKDIAAPAFKFEKKGDEVCGEILGIGEFTGQYGTQTVLTIEDDDHGQVSVFCGPTILARKIEELPLEPGDEIDIIFDGLGGKKDNTKMFKVYAERNGEPLRRGGGKRAEGSSLKERLNEERREDRLADDDPIPF